MKSKIKFAALAVILAAVIIAAVWGYNKSKEYSDKNGGGDIVEYLPGDSGDDGQETDKMPAADFQVLDFDEREVSLTDHIGKPTVVNFWATWCPPCKSELPAFDKLYAEYGDRVDFMMVDLTDGQRDTVDVVKEFVDNNDYSFPVYFDTKSSAAAAYGVYSIPMTVFIDEEGYITGTHIGAMEESTLKEYLDKLDTKTD
ncbi:MAG: TlpA family protein disulfide reductase [Oscillospiraceae bacterium]|nr:TlpA family protein disulfide reductase [Oscillospiraceae bacterium]